jgi:hypothetical protein
MCAKALRWGGFTLHIVILNIAQERDRPDMARRWAQWPAYQNRIDPAGLVFINETWTKTNINMARLGAARPMPAGQGAARPLEDPDPHRRLAARSGGGAHG